MVSFTPCLYPLLPIIVTYIGAEGVSSRKRGLVLSLIYVTGLSITYAVLGLIAAVTGSIFGEFSSLPWVRIVAGVVILLFGFSLWRGTGGGFRLILNVPILRKPGTYLSCLILGLTSGLVVGPCTAPVLGSILTFVATKRNFVYGAFLLFSFAYGMGLLLILAGTFSSFLALLPKSGRWMESIRKLCAAILFIAGIYIMSSGITNLVDVYLEESKAAVRDNYTTELDFSLRDLQGNKITLSDFRHRKSVILFFWTTWCPFCRRELDKLNQIYPALISDNIELLAINVEEAEYRVKRFLKTNLAVFPILLDLDAAVAEAYGLVGVPTFVFINKIGKVVFQDHYFPQNTYKRLLIGK